MSALTLNPAISTISDDFTEKTALACEIQRGAKLRGVVDDLRELAADMSEDERMAAFDLLELKVIQFFSF